MVHCASAGDSLVGVTHECDYPAGVEKLPKLTRSKVDSSMSSADIDAAISNILTDDGSIYALDAGLLEKLAPDLIITQGLCEVCAVSTDLVHEAASKLEKPPEVLSLNPTCLEDVFRDTVRVGEAVGRGEETRRKVETLRERLARVEEAVSGLDRPHAGCIEWLDPPFSAGHWVPEMVSIAGGQEIFAEAGEPSKRITWEQVLETAPDVLVLMPCGFDAERAVREARHLPELPGWGELPAVKSRRVWVVDANSHFSRPAPRLVEGVEVLARIFHPEVFPDAPVPKDAVRLSFARYGASSLDR